MEPSRSGIVEIIMYVATLFSRSILKVRFALMIAASCGALGQGCYQAPASTNGGEYSSAPVNAPNADSTPTAPPETTPHTEAKTAYGAMTLTPDSNPFVCLTASSLAAGAPLALSTCNQSPAQLWQMNDGRLKISSTLCLGTKASGTEALKTTPVLVTCDPNNLAQSIFRGSTNAALVIETDRINFSLGALSPTSGTSTVAWLNADSNDLGQRWNLGSDNAASGSLQSGTFKIAPVAYPKMCVTVFGETVFYSACEESISQGFRWNDAGQIVHGQQCLSGVKAGSPVLKPCDVSDSNQVWFSRSGLIICAGASACIDTTAAKTTTQAGISMVACPNEMVGNSYPTGTFILGMP